FAVTAASVARDAPFLRDLQGTRESRPGDRRGFPRADRCLQLHPGRGQRLPQIPRPVAAVPVSGLLICSCARRLGSKPSSCERQRTESTRWRSWLLSGTTEFSLPAGSFGSLSPAMGAKTKDGKPGSDRSSSPSVVKTFLLGLLVGAMLTAVTGWYLFIGRNSQPVVQAQDAVARGLTHAVDAVEARIEAFQLNGKDIKADMLATGQVVRHSVRAVGTAVVDATNDPRITTTIKAKLLANH